MASPKLVGDAGNLRIQTFVNGESRQDSNTNDFAIQCKEGYQFHQSGHNFGTGHCHNDWHALGSCIRHETKTGMVEGWRYRRGKDRALGIH
jgi:hypothetical protein